MFREHIKKLKISVNMKIYFNAKTSINLKWREYTLLKVLLLIKIH